MCKKVSLLSSVVLILSLLIFLPGCSKYKVVKRYTGAQAAQHLRGRIWVDRYPEKARDPFLIYYFDNKRELGVHIRALSSYKTIYEYFAYKADPERLQLNFLHDGRRAETKYVIEQISPVGKFNLKLTILNDPQEKGRRFEYFSNTSWGNSDGLMLPETVRDFFNN